MVLLHGSGDSGEGLRNYLTNVGGGRFLRSFEAAGARIVLPDSGLRSYSLMGGMPMAIWYDRKGLPPSSPEVTDSVEASVAKLRGILEELHAEGIPPKRIVVGGFSMGGGIALQLALRHPDMLGAAFVLSSFMCDDAAAYKLVEQRSREARASWPPIFMAHGQADGFIRPEWGKRTFLRLEAAGLPIKFVSVPRLRHELSAGELDQLGEWLRDLFPPGAGSGSGSRTAPTVAGGSGGSEL